jgi:thiol-disulfide isomerase/thioredoxin
MKMTSVVLLALSLATGSALGASLQRLQVGDSAPALNVMTWLKGEPVARFEPGHVYVVDFWSTWCPVCAAAMRHLSAMQSRYQGKLTIIGVNAREAVFGVDAHEQEYRDAGVNLVKKFVARKGDQMAYTLAMDDPDKGTVFRAWATAAGKDLGMPIAFIVDRSGKVAWIGPPFAESGFDAAVEQTVNGLGNIVGASKTQVTLAKEATKGVDLLKPMHEAQMKEDYAQVLIEADKVVVQAPEFAPYLFADRLGALLHTSESEALRLAAEKAADKTVREGIHVHTEDEYWSYVDFEIADQNGLSRGSYQSAADRLQDITAHHPNDFKSWLGLAMAQSQLGNLGKAIAAQQRAINLAKNNGVTVVGLAKLTGTLKHYKARRADSAG